MPKPQAEESTFEEQTRGHCGLGWGQGNVHELRPSLSLFPGVWRSSFNLKELKEAVFTNRLWCGECLEGP